jgi:hypothetical protein
MSQDGALTKTLRKEFQESLIRFDKLKAEPFRMVIMVNFGKNHLYSILEIKNF